MIFFEVLRFVLLSIGLACFLITIYAAWKGPIYIHACSKGNWHPDMLAEAFIEDRLGYIIFTIAPFALMIIGVVAATSTLDTILSPLGNIGFIDGESEWMTYRLLLATTVGFPIGLFVVQGVIRTCEKVPIGSENTDNLLKFMIGK